jgi:hypothetical protein
MVDCEALRISATSRADQAWNWQGTHTGHECDLHVLALPSPVRIKRLDRTGVVEGCFLNIGLVQSTPRIEAKPVAAGTNADRGCPVVDGMLRIGGPRLEDIEAKWSGQDAALNGIRERPRDLAAAA